MQIGYLGSGVWGRCLAKILAKNGHHVRQWLGNLSLKQLQEREVRAKAPSNPNTLTLHNDLGEVLHAADIVVESITSRGLRPVLSMARRYGMGDRTPLVLTSKGIEQESCLLMSEVACDVLGADLAKRIGCLSGPSLAVEVDRKLPTSVVASAYDKGLMETICTLFSTPYLRVYPNPEMAAVSFGGAMKNIIAIACAISDGLGFGENTKAALMTRGLHEIRKLGVTKGCSPDALNGLSGMGDLCATCLSTHSRNYKFGTFLAQGFSPEQAREKVGMVVEGVHTCLSAVQLAQKYHIDIPITEAIYAIIYKGVEPKMAVEGLLSRKVKLESV